MVEIELKTNVKVSVDGEPIRQLRAGVVRVSKAAATHLVSVGLAEEIQRAEPAPPPPAKKADPKPSAKAKTRKKKTGG